MNVIFKYIIVVASQNCQKDASQFTVYVRKSNYFNLLSLQALGPRPVAPFRRWNSRIITTERHQPLITHVPW